MLVIKGSPTLLRIGASYQPWETAKIMSPFWWGKTDAVLLYFSPYYNKVKYTFSPCQMKTLSLAKLSTISCDSGRLIITDPSYINSSKNINDLISTKLAYCFSTEIGDGEFTVKKKRDRQGNLQQIIINIQWRNIRLNLVGIISFGESCQWVCLQDRSMWVMDIVS